VSIDFFHSILKSSEVNNKENLSNQENLLKLCLVQNFAFLYIYLYLHYFFVSILAMLEDILYNFLKFMMDLKRALKSCKFRILI